MNFAAHRPRVTVTILSGTALVIAAARPAIAQPQNEFTPVLADVGVDLDVFASLANAGGELTAEQLKVVDQVLFRLEQFERGQIAGLSAARLGESHERILPHAGELLRMEGVVTTQSKIPRSDGDDATALWRYELKLSTHEVVTVISPHAPRLWTNRTLLHEPVQVICVWAGFPERDRTHPVILVNRLRWFPTDGVPSGVAWLAANGFDAALFEDVRPVSAFGKPHESREAEAFYTALATVARGDGDELRRLAQQEVHDAVGRWRELAEKESAEEDASNLNARIAGAVARSAERGVSSVGPMYLAPADTMGRLVLIEGVARRAVRIVVDDAAAPADLLEYIELDLFTADSENLPVICAVARLPAGFPTGDRINEPVRVTGVFLKRWAYVARPDADEGEAAQRMAAPLVLAAEPQWLRTADAASATGQGVWFGLAFVAVLGLIWLAVALAGRSDRLARSRRTSYDADLGVGIGPPPADQ